VFLAKNKLKELHSVALIKKKSPTQVRKTKHKSNVTLLPTKSNQVIQVITF